MRGSREHIPRPLRRRTRGAHTAPLDRPAGLGPRPVRSALQADGGFGAPRPLRADGGDMRTRFTQKIEKLEARVLEGPGVLESFVRRAAFQGRSLDDSLADRFVQNVHQHAYKIEE